MSDKPFLAAFLTAVHSLHISGAGTKETSYYTALDNLLDGIGRTLKPRVRCVMQLKSLGAGNPDGGLFTSDQFDRVTESPKNIAAPARGVIEVKAPVEAVDFTAASSQVSKYWDRYRLVLVTNLRDWLLIGDRAGNRVPLERFTLADSAAAFWSMASQPTEAQKEQGGAFADFLARVLLHNAPLGEPKDLAWLLASYAREAAHRVDRATPAAQQQLVVLRQSLESALGVNFEDKEGEHFFRSTLVQTLFYGVFAAWVLRHTREAGGTFDWRTAAHDLNVPMISALFEQLSQPTKLKALGLTVVLDWAADALNRVDQPTFFKKFEARQSVQYFYEPFLEAFDPALRKQLGVWYTPREIVRYQVERVDHALRTGLGIADGLADPQVIVLDPCCGTGAYLVEVLDLISRRLTAQGNAALAGQELKRAVQERIFGFELLPAPYVIAHLQLGLVLRSLNAPLESDPMGGGERAGVFLTNALTGWSPPKAPKTQLLPFPELAAERDAANSVKREQKILVILGNPPYNGYAGVVMGEERELSEAYRVATTGPQPQGRGLNELYVRFFRMAERQIVDHTGRGIICFVTNSSWLDGLSHTAMRERFLAVFDHVRIDNLHGDKYRTGKLTPDGQPDPSAFSTPQNREGIQVGTAIALLMRRAPSTEAALVEQRDWYGRSKLEDMASAAESLDALAYVPVSPQVAIGRTLVGKAAIADYLEWPTLPELFPFSASGALTKRDQALVDFQSESLVARMRLYFDSGTPRSVLEAAAPSLMRDADQFQHEAIRKALVERGMLDQNVVRYLYRPFDLRWVYWEPETNLLGRKSPDYFAQVFPSNQWLLTTGRTRKGTPEPPIAATRLADLNVMDSGLRATPMLVRQVHGSLAGVASGGHPNLGEHAAAYLKKVGGSHDDLFFHSLAVMHSAAYREANAGGLRQEWPRIPLPNRLDTLRSSGDLGREIAALLNIESPVPGVTTGTLRSELIHLASVARLDGQPLAAVDFALTAGWGSAGKGGVKMPGKGRVVERSASAAEAASGFGTETHDVYLNPRAYWRHVPPAVWNYTLGGYQVLKKWLSYREQALLGRPLTLEEVKTFPDIARRIAALCLLGGRLEANYLAVASSTVNLRTSI